MYTYQLPPSLLRYKIPQAKPLLEVNDIRINAPITFSFFISKGQCPYRIGR